MLAENPLKEKKLSNIFLSIIDSTTPAIFLFFLTFALYIVIIHFYYEYNNNYAPTGDPFSYTITWFDALNKGHTDYLSTLIKSLLGKSSWYQLQYLLASLFAPILYLDPASITIINFFSFFVATFSLYRLAFTVIPQRYLALSCSLLYWFLPAFYGTTSSVSLFILQLDTIFLNFLCAATANALVFVLKPQRTLNAVIAGIMVGLASWGRGNSLAYILIITLIPSVILLKYFWNPENRSQFPSLKNNLLIAFLLTVFLVGFYYFQHFKTIIGYYTPHYDIAHHSSIKWGNVILQIKNFPGIYLAPSPYLIPNTFFTILSTLLSHIIVITAAAITFIKPIGTVYEKRALKIISITSIFIFYATLILMATVFNASYYILWHPYVSMLISLILSLLTLTFYLILAFKKNNLSIQTSKFFFIVVAVTSLIFGYFFSEIKTAPKTDSNLISPKDIEYFSVNMERFFKNSSIAFLWYETYNQPIINYYRIINALPTIPEGGYDLALRCSENTNIKAQLDKWKNRHNAGDILFICDAKNNFWKAYLMKNEQKELEQQDITPKSILGKELAKVNPKNISTYDKDKLQELLQSNALFANHTLPNSWKSLEFYSTPMGKTVLWTPTDQPKLAEMKQQLTNIINDADYIVIPDCISSYDPSEAYPLYQHHEILQNVLNSPDSPRFAVKMVLLHEIRGRLLILQRLKKGDTSTAGLDLFPKPFPNEPNCKTIAYPHAMKIG